MTGQFDALAANCRAAAVAAAILGPDFATRQAIGVQIYQYHNC